MVTKAKIYQGSGRYILEFQSQKLTKSATKFFQILLNTDKGQFTNYVCKRRGIGGQKTQLFVRKGLSTIMFPQFLSKNRN